MILHQCGGWHGGWHALKVLLKGVAKRPRTPASCKRRAREYAGLRANHGPVTRRTYIEKGRVRYNEPGQPRELTFVSLEMDADVRIKRHGG